MPINQNIQNSQHDHHLVQNEDVPAVQRDYQSTAPPQASKLSQPNKLDHLNQWVHQSRPVTQKNKANWKDPLKNSLFHNVVNSGGSGLKTQNTQRYRHIFSKNDKNALHLALQGRLESQRNNYTHMLSFTDGKSNRGPISQSPLCQQLSQNSAHLNQQQLPGSTSQAASDPYEVQVTAENINLINHLYRTNQSITSRSNLTNEVLHNLESQYLNNSSSYQQLLNAGKVQHHGAGVGAPQNQTRN